MPPSSSSNGGRLCSPDSGIYSQSHKRDEKSSLSSFYIPPRCADADTAAAATVSDLQQFECGQQVSSRLAAAVQRAVPQQWRRVGVRGQANLRHHHRSSQILRLGLRMAEGGGKKPETGSSENVSESQTATKVDSSDRPTYQRVVVVHLDDDARRLLLDVLEISAQQQAVHQQTLIPRGAESLTDHLRATQTHKDAHTVSRKRKKIKA